MITKLCLHKHVKKEGFDDLSEDEAQDLANVVVREARTEIALQKAAVAAKADLKSSAKPTP